MSFPDPKAMSFKSSATVNARRAQYTDAWRGNLEQEVKDMRNWHEGVLSTEIAYNEPNDSQLLIPEEKTRVLKALLDAGYGLKHDVQIDDNGKRGMRVTYPPEAGAQVREGAI